MYSAYSLVIFLPTVSTVTLFLNIVVCLFLSKVISLASINKFSAFRFELKKILELLKKIYFSFICKIPIKVKKLKAIIGDQIDKTIGILPVFPNAKDKSLR